jgi:hypothetical protein
VMGIALDVIEVFFSKNIWSFSIFTFVWGRMLYYFLKTNIRVISSRTHKGDRWPNPSAKWESSWEPYISHISNNVHTILRGNASCIRHRPHRLSWPFIFNPSYHTNLNKWFLTSHDSFHVLHLCHMNPNVIQRCR